MKTRILEAAALELNERGVKFTVDRVAARLGISKKTVYQHYTSKDELISCIVTAVLTDMAEQEQAILSSNHDFAQKLIQILNVKALRFGQINDWVLEDVKRYRPQDWLLVEQFRRNHSSLVMKLLEDGAASGTIRPVQAAVASRMLLGAVGQLFDYRFLSEHNVTFQDALEVVTDIFLRGVLPDAGHIPAKEASRI